MGAILGYGWVVGAGLAQGRAEQRECAVTTVRTGVAWSSLIGVGSSEVGARSPAAVVGIAFVCMS